MLPEHAGCEKYHLYDAMDVWFAWQIDKLDRWVGYMCEITAAICLASLIPEDGHVKDGPTCDAK
jgi:hypothetical protein